MYPDFNYTMLSIYGCHGNLMSCSSITVFSHHNETKSFWVFPIHPEFMVANQEIIDQFIQNIKSNPNKVHDLTGEMKKSLKK